MFEPYRYRSRPTDDAPHRTILLVGNQTLDREAVLDEVTGRAGDGARVHVVVPATPHSHEQGRAAGSDDERGADMGAALARHRLQAVLARLRSAGVEADGEVGVADPYAAVCQVLGAHDVDEILLSTLPPSSSRWLSVDLPDRLRRRTRRPVTVLTPAAVGRGAG